MSYFQTWALASIVSRKSKLVGAALRWLCSKITGHEASMTEWGYGRGDTADVWCRWCNLPGSMPRSAAEKRFENMRRTIWKIQR